MCLTAPIKTFPPPTPGSRLEGVVRGYSYGSESAGLRIAILPDIYGCSPFYRSLAARYAEKGAYSLLIDPFAGFGELSTPTRADAFARRHKVHDKRFIDDFEAFITEHSITAVVGFCLGAFYIFELARRHVLPELVGFYGFPQGMANIDPLPVPFDYLAMVKKPFTMLMGEKDEPVGEDNIRRLQEIAPGAPAMRLTTYPGVGHNFLSLIDAVDEAARAVACDSLSVADAILLNNSRMT